MQEEGKRFRMTRRRFLGKAAATTAAAGAAAAVINAGSAPKSAAAAAAAAGAPAVYAPPVYQDIVLRVNGQDQHLQVDTRTTLAEALREGLHLTGTKVPCDQGECGGCTVLVDGRDVYSCSMLAVAAQGHDILTIEGLSAGGQLHPIQAAFMAQDASQCGFCTSGQILSIYVLLKNNPNPDEAAIRQAIQGNLCRCGTYTHIVAAAKAAASNS